MSTIEVEEMTRRIEEALDNGKLKWQTRQGEGQLHPLQLLRALDIAPGVAKRYDFFNKNRSTVEQRLALYVATESN
jgi:hypothetical protein